MDGVVGLLVLCNADWDFVFGGGGGKEMAKTFSSKRGTKDNTMLLIGPIRGRIAGQVMVLGLSQSC